MALFDKNSYYKNNIQMNEIKEIILIILQNIEYFKEIGNIKITKNLHDYITKNEHILYKIEFVDELIGFPVDTNNETFIKECIDHDNTKVLEFIILMIGLSLNLLSKTTILSFNHIFTIYRAATISIDITNNTDFKKVAFNIIIKLMDIGNSSDNTLFIIESGLILKLQRYMNEKENQLIALPLIERISLVLDSRLEGILINLGLPKYLFKIFRGNEDLSQNYLEYIPELQKHLNYCGVCYKDWEIFSNF